MKMFSAMAAGADRMDTQLAAVPQSTDGRGSIIGLQGSDKSWHWFGASDTA